AEAPGEQRVVAPRVVAICDQALAEMGAEKAGPTGDKDLHRSNLTGQVSQVDHGPAGRDVDEAGLLHGARREQVAAVDDDRVYQHALEPDEVEIGELGPVGADYDT